MRFTRASCPPIFEERMVLRKGGKHLMIIASRYRTEMFRIFIADTENNIV